MFSISLKKQGCFLDVTPGFAKTKFWRLQKNMIFYWIFFIQKLPYQKVEGNFAERTQWFLVF